VAGVDKMNRFTKPLLLPFLIFVMLGFMPSAHARLFLITGGEIQSLSNTSMTVGDQAFPVSPTVKVLSAKKKPLSLRHLKIGDIVRVEVHEVAGKRFIDRISLLPNSKK
jgi:hypothetical protein